MANNFSEHNHFYLKDFNFIPSIEIKLLSALTGQSSKLDELASQSDEIDIWDGPINLNPAPKIDIDKL
jgi:hypothetical protein